MDEKVTGYRKITNELVRNGTGKDWRDWFQILDRWNVHIKGHSYTVRYLQRHHGLSRWWAVAVTLRYEREKGIKR